VETICFCLFVIFLSIIITLVFDYGKDAWLPLYQILTKTVIGLNPWLFGLLLILFEVTMGILILAKEFLVKIGLIGTMLFVLHLCQYIRHKLPGPYQ